MMWREVCGSMVWFVLFLHRSIDRHHQSSLSLSNDGVFWTSSLTKSLIHTSTHASLSLSLPLSLSLSLSLSSPSLFVHRPILSIQIIIHIHIEKRNVLSTNSFLLNKYYIIYRVIYECVIARRHVWLVVSPWKTCRWHPDVVNR